MSEPATSTRERVRAAVSQDGPITARELSDQLDLTAAAVRRHLDALAAEGVIAEHEHELAAAGTRGRGRPARAWVLSDAGHTTLPTAYDEMAVELLEFLQATGGTEAVAEYARRRAEQLVSRYADAVREAGEDPVDRAHALSAELAGDGYAPSVRQVPQVHGVQLCQGHCPVQQAAEAFPALCEAEAEAFSELLGVHVQRLQTLPVGGHVCTTFVPASAVTVRPGPDTSTTHHHEERSR
ncbi:MULTISPECIES: helix-turn-helix transcriptional regulator [Kytococcus]|uniref:HTH domain-containing protein n=1 Tax=Kytococcus schroeteri TaxID=138300 RepID=A0A2I1PE01_9MICO|nr:MULTISPECIES: winged helix-turn-helix transcriptional regulator [Kytococcus]OFS08073.1 transcriptional regulator [Kytococcus sp. HMSC28H12]PKZ42856.1 HTH domain-containing protein [Kytococcus schroeteri]